MKKTLKLIVSAVIAILLVAISVPAVFADTASPSPTASPTYGEKPEVKQAVSVDKDGNEAVINKDAITIVSFTEAKEQDNEKAVALKAASEALTQVLDRNYTGEYTTAQKESQEKLQEALSNLVVEGKVYKYDDYDATNLFEVTITAEIQEIFNNGGTVKLTFDYVGDKKPIVIHQREDESREWDIVDADKVKLLEGQVEVEFEHLCPVAFLAVEENAEPVAIQGPEGNGIDKIEKVGSENGVDTYRITFTDGTTFDFEITNGQAGDPGEPGEQGEAGKSISKVEKTGSANGVDTYTITFSDNSTATFTVTNGQAGDPGTPGDKGEAGDKGDKGDKGEAGAVGPKGDKGDSAPIWIWIVIIVLLVIIIILLIIFIATSRNRKDDDKEEPVEEAPVEEETPVEEEQAVEETPAEEEPVEEAPVEEETPVEEEQPVEEAPVEEEPEEEQEEAEDEEDEDDENAAPVVVPIVAAEGEEPVEEKDEYLCINYNKSHIAKLVALDDNMRQCYQLIKDLLCSYQVTNRVSWKYETFSKSRETFAKIMIRGKTLNLYLTVDVEKYASDPKNPLEPDKDGFAVIKIKSMRRTKYALQVLKDLLKSIKAEKVKDFTPVDFFEPYKGETEKSLIAKDLIKMVVERSNKPKPRAKQYKLLKETSVYNIHKYMDDNDAVNLVEKANREIDETNFGVIFTDQLCEVFEDGDTVDLAAIKAKVKGVDKKMTAYKLKPRGKMNKALTIDCDAFTLGAAKMVALTGGQLLSPSDQGAEE